MLIKRMMRLVPPFEQRRIRRQLRNQLRMIENNIAPHLNALAVRLRQRIAVIHPIDIHLPYADLLCKLPRPPLAQVPTLIATNIKLPAAEVRRELVIHIFQKRLRRRIGDAQGPGIITPSGHARLFQLVRICLGEVPKRGPLQNFVKVPQRRQRRNKINVPRPARRIEQQNLLRRERRRVIEHLRMPAKLKRVLDVNLKLVVLEMTKIIDQLQQRIDCRHLPARAVVIHAAPHKIRPILNRQHRQRRSSPPLARLLRDTHQRSRP